MRVVAPDNSSTTVFFWPADEAVVTAASSGRIQAVSNYLGELAASGDCVPPGAYPNGIDASKLAQCVYEEVEIPFGAPRGVAVVNGLGGSELLTRHGHLLRYQFSYLIRAALGPPRMVLWVYTVWCLY